MYQYFLFFVVWKIVKLIIKLAEEIRYLFFKPVVTFFSHNIYQVFLNKNTELKLEVLFA